MGDTEKRQIQMSMICYNRNMDKMRRDARGQLEKPSRGAKTHPVKSPI